ncbi:hypothetical protein AGMMS49975_15900 [Clostridia bacterium]|nr:hypothetical protein AGMMS49975_15900 [Clostridia bacterium]
MAVWAESVYCDDADAIAVGFDIKLQDALTKISNGKNVKFYAITDYGKAAVSNLWRIGFN